MKLEVVADLLAAVADFVAEHPVAAAYTARKLSGILQQQAYRENERREEEARRNVARGF